MWRIQNLLSSIAAHPSETQAKAKLQQHLQRQ